MHGGTNPGRPPITGRYSKVLRAALRQKLAEFLADGDYANIAEELCLQRALLAEHLAGLEGRTLTLEDTDRLLFWTTRITMTAERASRIESRTALTIAEVRLLEAGIVSLLQQMLSPSQAEEFSRRLAAMLGEHSLPALPEAQGAEVWGGLL